MAKCWGLRMPPSAKAVLMSLADQANDDGVCWPSQGTLCERTCLGERAVRSALRWLEQACVLTTDVRHDKRGRRSSNSYTLTPAHYTPPAGFEAATAARDEMAATAPTAHAAESAAAAPARGGVVGGCDAPPPAFGAGGTTGTWRRHHRHLVPGHYIEPSKEPNTPQPPSRGAPGAGSAMVYVGSAGSVPCGPDRDDGLMELKTAVQLAKAAGEDVIPADDPVFAYAQEAGIPREFLLLAWAEFKARRGTKRQRGLRGWRQAFRTCVRDNWYRLWFLRPGMAVAELTTQGLQAQAVFAARQAEREQAQQGQAPGQDERSAG